MCSISNNVVVMIVLIFYVPSRMCNRSFDTIVGFGDANTDTGNVYTLTNHTWPLVPPYYRGRFCDNLLWIERLNIANVLSYAYGDATIDNDNLIAGYTYLNRTQVYGIRQQIVLYLQSTDISKVDLSRTMYVLWAGGAEYLLDPKITPDTVVNAFLSTVYDLLLLNINYLIVINVPPLQFYPGMMNNSQLETSIIEHNQLLLSNITQIKENFMQTSIQLFDVYSLISAILWNNSVHSLNTTGKCWDIENKTIVSLCSNPQGYVFLDDNHLTSSMHQTIANNIQSLLTSLTSRTMFSLNLTVFICTVLFLFKHY